MAQTFTKILIHYIWSTKNRIPIITPEVEPNLHAYMVGIARNLDCWVMAVNGMPDHVHLLVSMSKHITVIEFMETVKKESSKWIKLQSPSFAGFHWQDGYAGLSIGESGIPTLKRYIAAQKQHHRRMTFQEELIKFLQKYGIEYDERYIWT